MTGPEDVLAVWFAPPEEAWASRWFKADPEFDATLRQRFGKTLAAARNGELDHWASTPRGALALVIVLDQFSRNLHRNSPEAFAADGKARGHAREAIGRGFDRQLAPVERSFFYLPFEHSENPADQDLSVRLFESLPRDEPILAAAIDYAHRHRAVIERFGRFPHRNAVLGRASTAAEIAFLKERKEGF